MMESGLYQIVLLSSPGLTRRSIVFEKAGSPGLGAARRPGDDSEV